MSASGVSPTKSIEINAVISQSEALRLLNHAFQQEYKDWTRAKKRNCSKSYWLLRESTTPGMITVDILPVEKGNAQRGQSVRLALLLEPSQNLRIVKAHGEYLSHLEPGTKWISMTRETLIGENVEFVNLLCQFLKDNYHLANANYVAPSLAIVTRNKVRDLAAILNKPHHSQESIEAQTRFINTIFDEMSDLTTCAILSEPLFGERAAILPSGKLVSPRALLKSTVGRLKSEDPFTRLPMKPEDVLWINDFENINLDVSDTTFLPKCG